ncbi:MAG: heparan-alpha-glucosaminide N-acetyltransferase domain-containing protein [Ketobacteraceae bacterium]|nr:heparan-alpha-glucosaminide N-acetyltransferase domain-containing protein [Ketobacteraceae bacterium]
MAKKKKSSRQQRSPARARTATQSSPGEANVQKLTGLNIYRAVAIFMMMAAHSIRIQENYPTLATHPESATLFDRFLLLFITIEPIISAMFLFIAGFSLTLSFSKMIRKNPARKLPWLQRILGRAAALYGVAVIFFVAEYGFQWPDFLVSAGVLGTIALSIAISAGLLVWGGHAVWLIVATLLCLAVTYGLEANNLTVTGLNAGAGGHLPLVVMGFLGTLYGLAYRRFGDNGLFGGLLLSAVIALLAFVADYPNTFIYRSHFAWYASSLPAQWLESALNLFSRGNDSALVKAAFWNHSSIYPLRFTFVIVLFMVPAIKLFRRTQHRVIRFLDALGSYGLTIYVFHLVILAGLEVSGIKPQTGWQTLVLIAGLILTGYGAIRNRVNLDPGAG